LWQKIAAKEIELGNPVPFFSNSDQTKSYSFTATFNGDNMLKMIEEYSGN
jgi:oleate hydratase